MLRRDIMDNSPSQKIITETKRLLLRETTLDDLDFMAAMLGDPEVMRFWPRPISRKEAETEIHKIQGRYALHGCSFWTVIEKASGQPVGQAGILIQEINGVEEAALAYKTHRPFWRRGFATEAARACLDFAFNVLRRPRVVTLIRPENIPSTNLALKFGMKGEGHAQLAGFDHIVYTLANPTLRKDA